VGGCVIQWKWRGISLWNKFVIKTDKRMFKEEQKKYFKEEGHSTQGFEKPVLR
jgi:hypothetical protein